MEIYKNKISLGKTKNRTLVLKTPTNFSEPSGVYQLTGMNFEYSPNRKVLYMFPLNSKGEHSLRWMSIEKEDIKNLINELSEFVK